LLKFRVLLLPILVSVSVVAEPSGSGSPDVILQNYCAAERMQASMARGASMDVDIAASLPKLKKLGSLHALRRISMLGRITYEMLRFEGDGTVKNQVIARYLTAEAEAQKSQMPSMAVTPDNYKFHYKGRGQLNGRDTHIFQVTPRQKRAGLFKGELWVDSATYLRVQEAGYLVKNPSLFLKKVAFVRRYEIRDGMSVPVETQSTVDTRLVGKAELTIEYRNFSLETPRLGDDEAQ
jgi:hypothetical protein